MLQETVDCKHIACFIFSLFKYYLYPIKTYTKYEFSLDFCS